MEGRVRENIGKGGKGMEEIAGKGTEMPVLSCPVFPFHFSISISDFIPLYFC